MITEKIIPVLREAGAIVLGAHDIGRGIATKEGRANFVTEYDSAVQKFLFERLGKRFPDAAFVGEEDSADDIARLCSGRAFVIDPIDGTQNFIKGLRLSVISVAFCENGEVTAGAVYNPYSDEMFCAEAGQGAWLICGGKRREMHVSASPLSEGIVLFGSAPYNTELHDRTFAVVRTLFDHALDIRRCGAAALDLCMLADGRAEVFTEMILSPWDFAAGSLIVREAGGIVTQADGSPLRLDRKCSLLAGNPAAYAAAKALVEKII